MYMEDSLRLSVDPQDADGALRVELVFCNPESRTRISVETRVRNSVGHSPLLRLQADVLRMAIADLQEEVDSLEHSLAESNATP